MRLLDLEGEPLRGLQVEIRPEGDRLRFTEPLDLPLTPALRDKGPRMAVADASGYISFEYPAWTHVRLVAPAHEIHYDRLIPDFVTSMEVVAAPKATVALKVRLPCGAAPAALDALVGGTCGTPPGVATTFRLVRKLGDRGALYVAKKSRRFGPRMVADLRAPDGGIVARDREIDLSGGWTEPLDLRPDPGERGPCGCGTGCID